MWVYREAHDGAGVFWTVGFYDPTGIWIADSDHRRRENARRLVHYINGGKSMDENEGVF